jgi:hypothetical protein
MARFELMEGSHGGRRRGERGGRGKGGGRARLGVRLGECHGERER